MLRDQEGQLNAVAAGAVSMMKEVDDGTLLLMPGCRVLSVPRALRTVLGWLDVEPDRTTRTVVAELDGER